MLDLKFSPHLCYNCATVACLTKCRFLEGTKKPYALVVCAGNDGTGAVSHIERILTGLKLKKAQKPLICRGEITENEMHKCYELGRILAEGVHCGVF